MNTHEQQARDLILAGIRVPKEIAEHITELDLRNTQVTNFAPLSGLTALQSLYLNGTQVADFAPLSGLRKLTWLGLSNTQVSDFTPINHVANIYRD